MQIVGIQNEGVAAAITASFWGTRGGTDDIQKVIGKLTRPVEGETEKTIVTAESLPLAPLEPESGTLEARGFERID